ncbi:MAG: sugar dehydrogenase complex small subunit [Cobetia sp.]|uniref:sugar dehydrogenase complex small subunit n=1 Tax=Cobetia sp. TaxID=1873876 RepID=UPI003242BD1C
MSTSQSATDPSRRQLLKLGLGGAGMAVFGGLSLQALAETVADEQQTQDDSAFATFMVLSRWLLSDKTLDERLGQRYFEALARIPAEGVPGVGSLPALKARLLALGESREYVTKEDLSDGEMALVRRLLQAWMLGTVGKSISDPDAEVIAFERAGMYAGPRDVQVVRTYCSNRPGFWAEAPKA